MSYELAHEIFYALEFWGLDYSYLRKKKWYTVYAKHMEEIYEACKEAMWDCNNVDLFRRRVTEIMSNHNMKGDSL